MLQQVRFVRFVLLGAPGGPWSTVGPVGRVFVFVFVVLTVIVTVIIYSMNMLIMQIWHRLLPVEHRGAPWGPWSTVGPVGRDFVCVFVVLIVIAL